MQGIMAPVAKAFCVRPTCTHKAAEHMLQGHIWQEGFASGELTADLFPDVQPAMAAWISQGLKTYIYSSGSRQAQKNLFGYTSMGDLRGLLSGFFDTASGAKVGHYSLFSTRLLVCKCVYLLSNDSLSNYHYWGIADCTAKLSLSKRCFDEDCDTKFSLKMQHQSIADDIIGTKPYMTMLLQVNSSSYDNIALSLGVDKPSQIIFATDSILEAEAAATAGWQVALTVRPGNKPLPAQHSFRIIHSMQELVEPF